jgi:hypothetical protein
MEVDMTKLKLESLHNNKPVKITLELPAEIDRDLRAYADIMKRQGAEAVIGPTSLIAPMLKQFMATDRAFKRLRRKFDQDTKG